MGDLWAGTGFDRAAVTDSILARWQEFRTGVSPAAGDERFHAWLFGEVAGAGAADDHALFVFEVAMGMAERGMTVETFVLLRWLGDHYSRHPDPGVVCRMVGALTEDCTALGVRDAGDNARARETLRAVIDRAGPSPHVEVERALCFAHVHLAYLRGEAVAPAENKMSDVVRLWTEIASRWSSSGDPELRERVAQALTNVGFLALQDGDERSARESFAEVRNRFAGDRPHPDSELNRWLAVAQHAPGLLDRLRIGEPEFQLGYLRRRRHWHPDSQMEVLVDAARREHVRSAGAVHSWVCSGQPFVLLLRNFELTERSGVSDSPLLHGNEGGDHVQILNLSASWDPVLREFAGGVPLVQVASTTAGELEVNSFAGQFVAPQRLYLPATSWFETVRRLIAVADQIIVWADLLTPSLGRELAELAARGRTEDTLILLETPRHEPGTNVYLPRSAGQPLTPEDQVLAPFPHRAAGDGVRDLRVHEIPALMQLVDRLHEAEREPAAQRLHRTRARLDAVSPQ